MYNKEEKRMEQLMTVKDVAHALKKAVKTIYHYVESEEIPPTLLIRQGASIRMRPSDLEKWIESQRGK